MSEEGGLEEFEESFRAAASRRCKSATVAWRASNRACKASSCTCKRWQLAHGRVGSVIMAPDSMLPTSRLQHREPLQLHCERPPETLRPASAETGIIAGVSNT